MGKHAAALCRHCPAQHGAAAKCRQPLANLRFRGLTAHPAVCGTFHLVAQRRGRGAEVLPASGGLRKAPAGLLPCVRLLGRHPEGAAALHVQAAREATASTASRAAAELDESDPAASRRGQAVPTAIRRCATVHLRACSSGCPARMDGYHKHSTAAASGRGGRARVQKCRATGAGQFPQMVWRHEALRVPRARRGRCRMDESLLHARRSCGFEARRGGGRRAAEATPRNASAAHAPHTCA